MIGRAGRAHLRVMGHPSSGSLARWVTLRAAGRQPRFGTLVDGRVVATPLGELARQRWLNLPLEHPGFGFERLVLFPDRLEALVRGPRRLGRPDPLRGVIAHFKAMVTRDAGQEGRVWEPGYQAVEVAAGGGELVRGK